jgi:predicted SAM-dependent methyltransferase
MTVYQMDRKYPVILGGKEKSEDDMILKNAKINLGCGKVKLNSWINIDINPDADIILDLKIGLPFKDNSIQYIYSEHVFEHFTYDEGHRLLKECYRVLSDDGIMRISMPDLDYIIEKYLHDWKNQEWLTWPEYSFIQSKGMMLNIYFHWWDHKYLYNEEDLRNQLLNVKFKKIFRCEWSKSNCPVLCNLETRQDSKLVIETHKN